MKKRPFGIWILIGMAVIAAALAGVHALQALGIMPYFVGEYTFHAFTLWLFLIYALLVWVYMWLAEMLLNLDKKAWIFMAVITVFNLIIDFTVMLGASEWSDFSVSFILNAIILIYIMLPGVRRAFEKD
jgi:hypothetical protein